MPLAYVPSPINWVANQVVKAPELRAEVSGLVQLLAAPPTFLGSQQGAAQSIPNSSAAAVQLDTEFIDNFGGHLPHVSSTNYYGMFPGWYLVQCSAAFGNTLGGAGVTGCHIGFSSAGGGVTTFGGVQIANGNAATTYASAKLINFVNTGTFNGPANDYVQAIVFQDSGSAQTCSNITTNFPWLSARYISAASGTNGLPAPACPAWPAPPTVLGHSFLNTNLRDTIRFLTYPPFAEPVLNSAYSLPSQSGALPAVGTTIPLDHVGVDSYGAFSTSTHTYTAPANGVYYVYWLLSFTPNSTTDVAVPGITISSGNYNGGTQFTWWPGQTPVYFPQVNSFATRRRLRLNSGDTLQFAGYQHDSAGTAVPLGEGIANQNICRAIIIWLPR